MSGHRLAEPTHHGLVVTFETGDDGVIVGWLFGELDLFSTPKLDRELEVAFAGDACHTLILDVAGLTTLDSTGLRALWTIRHEMRDHGGKLILRAPSAEVVRVLCATGLETLFDIDYGRP
jgi:anti-sigma B factor antagonist